MKFKSFVITMMALSIAAIGKTAVAQDDEGQVAVVWTIVAKPGSAPAYRDAVAAHMKWRADNSDPWGWRAFEDSTGDPVNVMYFRSGNHHWADLDAYDASEFNQKANDHWNTHVDPHVESYDRAFSRTDAELRLWPEGGVYSHIRVLTFKLQPGHLQAFQATVAKTHAALVAADWDSIHVWIWPLDGTLNEGSVAIARGSWAGFEPGEKSVWETIIGELGNKKGNALRDEFNSHLKHVSAEYYTNIPELSIEAAK